VRSENRSEKHEIRAGRFSILLSLKRVNAKTFA
jgi:hypothetical protein